MLNFNVLDLRLHLDKKKVGQPYSKKRVPPSPKESSPAFKVKVGQPYSKKRVSPSPNPRG